MKLAIAFLLLGICLVPTNANYGKPKMTEQQGYSHARMFTMCMQRYIEIQKCSSCADVELFCRQRAFLEDICFLLKLLTNDINLAIGQLLARTNFGVHISFVIYAVENGNVDQLVIQVRKNRAWDLVYQQFCSILNASLQTVNVNLKEVIVAVNSCMGKNNLENAFGPIRDVVNVVSGAVTGIVGGGLQAGAGLVDSALGVAGVLTSGAAKGVAGGVLGAASGVLGAATDIVGGGLQAGAGLVDGAVGVVGGLTSSAAKGIAGGVLGAASGALGAASGVVGGGLQAVSGVAGGVLNAAGGLPGGSAGGHGSAGYGGRGNTGYSGQGNAGSGYYSKGSSYSPR